MTWGSGPGSGSGSVLSGSGTGLVKTMNPDPICPERFDPDPVNIGPESKMVPRICRTHLNKSERHVSDARVRCRNEGTEEVGSADALASKIITRDFNF